MKIAIDVSPLQTGHKIRGVGFYLRYLKKALLEFYPENEYIFFETTSAIPSDAAIVHYPYFDPFFLTLPIIRKHKTVVTVHDLTPIIFPKQFPAGLRGSLKWQIQKYNLKNVDAIITDSYASKKDILRIVGVPETNISVAYLAADDIFKQTALTNERKKDLQKKYNLPEKFALYVGDVTWNKNVPMLLKAIKNTDIHLVMVGKSLIGEQVDQTNVWNKSLIESQKLAGSNKNVQRLGFLQTEDLISLYNLATVFVFPSVYEGFGLPVIEAMQVGCPIITTKGGSLEEVGGDAALYFDGTNSNELAKAIIKVINSETLQENLIAKGLKQAARFSWQKTAEQTMAVYREVIERK